MAHPKRYVEVAGTVASDLVGWHRGATSTTDTYRAMRRLHQVTAGWSSRAIRNAMAVVPGAVDRVAQSRRPPLDGGSAEAVEALRREGVVGIDPVLSADRVQSLRSFALKAPGQARHADGRREFTTFEAARGNASAVFVEGRFAWARPEIQTVLADPRIWAMADHYFGMTPVVQPPQLYWTCATRSAELDAQASVSLARNYHWDYDGVGSLRLLVNLTDVDEGAAPMEYVPGSHRPGALRTRELRHADDGEASPGALASLGLDHGRLLVGPAGSTYLTDAFGLHRASAALEHDRLVLIVPIQAGGFSGYYNRPRRVPARDPRFAAALAAGRPELRLFRAGDPDDRVVTLADDADRSAT